METNVIRTNPLKCKVVKREAALLFQCLCLSPFCTLRFTSYFLGCLTALPHSLHIEIFFNPSRLSLCISTLCFFPDTLDENNILVLSPYHIFLQ